MILADPIYYERRGIDVLLGASVVTQILMAEAPILGTLTAQKTHLGWILLGDHNPPTTPRHCLVATRDSDALSSAVKRFWETEEKLPLELENVPEEVVCEEFYKKTTTRVDDGRYVFRLPFKENVCLGRSRHIAMGCLTQLEKRFRSNPSLKERYVSAMKNTLSWDTLYRRCSPKALIGQILLILATIFLILTEREGKQLNY